MKYNNLPLTVGTEATEATLEAKDGKLVVTINETKRPLAEGAKLDIQLDVKADEEVIATSNASFTIEKGEAAVPTTLAAINATYAEATDDQEEGDKVTDVLPGNAIKLTADVKDQYGNPVTTASGSDKLIRWVVKEGKDLVTDSKGEVLGATQDTATNELTFKAMKPGTFTIEAYNIANGDFKTYTVEIAASKLESIKVIDQLPENEDYKINKTPYNNEEGIVAVLKANPEGAALKAEDVKFDVKPGKDLTAEDITVTAEEITVGKGDAATKHIVVKATTKKAGTYTVTPFVGEAIDADKVAKGTAITVKTELNPTIESFTVEQVKENEVAVDKTVKKALTFVNKHGEEIVPDVKDIKVTQAGTGTVAGLNNSVKLNTETKKLEVELKGETEGNVTVTLVAGKAVQQLKFDVVGAAKVDKVNLGTNVTSGVVAGSEEEVVRPIEVKDQFGNDYIPASLDEIKIEKDPKGKNLTAELKYYTIDEETKEVTVQKDATNAPNADTKGVALVLKAEKASNTKDEKVKVTAKAKGSDKELSSTTVTIKAKAALKEVTVEAKSTTLTVGGKTTVLVKPVDQYGNVVAGLHDKIAVTPNDVVAKTNDAVAPVYHDKDGKVVEENAEGAKLVGYEVTVEGKKKGEVAAEFVVTKDDKAVKVTQNFKVDTTAALVEKVEIKEVEGVQNASGDNAVQLEAIVKDKNDTVVNVKPEELTWSIKGVKDAKGNVLQGEWDSKAKTFTFAENDMNDNLNISNSKIKLENGKLTVPSQDDSNNKLGLEGLTVDVTVGVKTQNFKEAETTVTIGTAEAAYKEGFKVAKITSGGKEVKFEGDGTEVEINDKSKKITFTFTGVDQYGKEMPIKDLKTSETAGTASVATSNDGDLKAEFADDDSDAASTLTVTAESLDGGEVYVSYKGTDMIIKVTVAGDAKAEIEKTLEEN